MNFAIRFIDAACNFFRVSMRHMFWHRTFRQESNEMFPTNWNTCKTVCVMCTWQWRLSMDSKVLRLRAGSGYCREVMQTLPFPSDCLDRFDIGAHEMMAAWFDILYYGNIFQDNIDGRYIDQNFIARDDIDDGDIDHKDIEIDMDDMDNMDDVDCIIIESVASWWRKVVTAATVTLKVFSHASSSNDPRGAWARWGSSSCPLQWLQ